MTLYLQTNEAKGPPHIRMQLFRSVGPDVLSGPDPGVICDATDDLRPRRPAEDRGPYLNSYIRIPTPEEVLEL